jgi:hypothetical protein
MKIKLDQKEVEEIILQFVNQWTNSKFNHVEFDTGYGYVREVTLSSKEQEDAE